MNVPRVGVTVYDLLLSCPGDVLDMKEIIDSCVKSFNSSIGEANNIRIDLKHWSTDSFSQFGDKPQNILNKQFIDNCDLCVALLGVRFGTPTDNYDSGTEEEIEKMLEQNKQVFLYFVERSVDPSTIDLDQYSKVQAFKKKYTDRGIYSTVKSASELRTEFQNALSLYFIKLVAPHISQLQPTLAPNLVIKSTRTPQEPILPLHTNYQRIGLVKQKRDAAIPLIDRISSLKIIPSVDESASEESAIFSDEELKEKTVEEVMQAVDNKQVPLKQYYRLAQIEPPRYEKETISETQSRLILDFCRQNGITLDSNFFSLGNLRKVITRPYISILGNGQSYVGSDSEKEKHSLMNDLLYHIREYNEVLDFFKKIDDMPCVSLMVENNGNTYDEDIDVKLFVEKGHLALFDDIPTPGLFFLEEAVELEAPKYLFAEHSHPEIDDFSHYPMDHFIPQDFPFMSGKEKSDQHRKRYSDLVGHVFCYDMRENESEDILCFNIPYLKQNTKMFFPSYLFFVSPPNTLRYEIRSKHSPEVYQGSLKIKSGRI